MATAAKKKINIIKRMIEYTVLTVLFLILLFVVLMRIQGKTPTFFGYRFYTVVSGSMEPELKVKDVIVSKTAIPAQLKEGDIVTYVGEAGDLKGKLITHKIVRVFEENGTLFVITQGTATKVDDPKIEAAKIEAVMCSKLTAVSGLLRFTSTPYGFILVIIIPLSGILVFQIISLVRRKKPVIKETDSGKTSEKTNDSESDSEA